MRLSVNIIKHKKCTTLCSFLSRYVIIIAIYARVCVKVCVCVIHTRCEKTSGMYFITLFDQKSPQNSGIHIGKSLLISRMDAAVCASFFKMHNFSTNKHKLNENKDFTQDVITMKKIVQGG